MQKYSNTNISIKLFEAIHARWVMLLRALDSESLYRSFVNPEPGTITKLDENIGIYSSHGKHHLAQIESCINNCSDQTV